MSDKRKAQLDDYADLCRRLRERSRNRCEAVTLVPEVACYGPLDPHHVHAGMGTRKLVADLEDMRHLCRAHHDWVHDHGTDARERGLLA